MTNHTIQTDQQVILVCWRDEDNLSQHEVLIYKNLGHDEINKGIAEQAGMLVRDALESGADVVKVEVRDLTETFNVEF